MQQASTHRLFSFILYTLAFLLFWEWLRPLSVISKGTDVSYFVCFTAFAFFLSYLRLPYWLSFPAKLLGVAYALHLIYFYNTPFFQGGWLHYFYNDLTENVSFIINGNWVGMTDLFRAFLFFVLLWIVSYLMHYWLIQARKLFLFFFVTIIYLTVIDSFTMYHADGAIVRTMIIGLVLIGLLRMVKIQEKEQMTFDRGSWPFSWFLGLIGLVVLSLVAGFAAPKVSAQWPDPVPFIVKAANGYAGSTPLGNQRIGYDSNDTHLGGAFSMDNTPVFTADTRYAHYWKIETKNTYTGKGWVNIPDNSFKTLTETTGLGANPSLKSYESETKTEQLSDTIHMELSNFPQLVYGGDPVSISGLNNDQLRLNDVSGKLEPQLRDRYVTPGDYVVQYNYPTFSIPLLRKVTDHSKDPSAVKKTYLQLPSTLPSRVGQLAHQLTDGQSNRYDKAQAIVSYLNGPEFSYNTTNVPFPGAEQDYVDQFLFDSHMGYCDNFSSSMVVLLRSVGIPARWVKGFSQGSFEKADNTTLDQYLVRESDAHAWVEVYFPGSGWVPFEPTKGFNNTFNFSFENPKAVAASTTPTAPKPKTANKPQPQQDKQATAPVHQSPMSNHLSHFLPHLKLKTIILWLVVFLAVLGVMVTIIMRLRRKWLPVFWKLRYKRREEEETLDAAFDRLMRLLALSGYVKKPSQTLREFASEVDRQLGTFEMMKLVRQIEKKRYASSYSSPWSESKEFWENMINRLRA